MQNIAITLLGIGTGCVIGHYGGQAGMRWYLNLPANDTLHAWRHRLGLSWGGMVMRYRGVDGHEHRGLVCATCGKIGLADETPMLEPKSRALAPLDARSLFSNMIWLRMSGENKENHQRRLELRETDWYKERVETMMREHGYSEEQIELSRRGGIDSWRVPALSP